MTALVVALAAAAALSHAGEPQPVGTVKIGMLKSMFRDVPPAMFGVMSKPFHSLVQTQTGLKGELCLIDSADALRKDMAEDKVQLGVFHGFEYAWMRLRQPDLRPLMLAVGQPGCLRALLVVPAGEADVHAFADLRGKTLALPRGTRENARLFLERQAAHDGQTPEQFFGKVVTPADAAVALNDVANGKNAQATVTDAAALACFKDLYPGQGRRLKVLAESDPFPATVIAYREGSLSADALRRFRDGMANAHNNPQGSNLMMLLKMSRFEPIPADYEALLAGVMKAYPPLAAPAN
jgi:ABC-type phosphate/phosphonate transport system substrate-binding protein